jgi:hypothetical protein
MLSRSRKSLAGLALAAGVMALAFAGDSALAEAAPAPACRKAEVNPVTGHVFCNDPITAPVDPPPAADLPAASQMSAATKLGLGVPSARVELRVQPSAALLRATRAPSG